MLILFYGEGRLGNQVFQYQALNQIARARSVVLAVGLEDLQEIFHLVGLPVCVLARGLALKRAFKFLLVPLFLRPMARYLRLIGYAFDASSGSAPHSGSSGEITLRQGLIRQVIFVDGGYYQNGCLWPKIFPTDILRVRDELAARAREYLCSVVPPQRRAVFVHVRRGDYLGFHSYGITDLVLPADYYRASIEEIRGRMPDAHFVFVTDDAQWVKHEFREIDDKSIAAIAPGLDFSIMTECRAGILSNSTFSLAAALLLREPEIVIGPEHWFGFRVGRWLPPRIRFQDPKLHYIPVPP